LGFDGVLENSIDAVSDRDFCQEIGALCCTIATHLSRYAEQMIMWANPAFGYVRFSDAWSTGSSMMPQKRNPDAMELIRGKSARIIGSATILWTMMKGLPLTYAKDMQEDKLPLFDACDQTQLCLAVFAQAVASAHFDAEAMRRGLTGNMLATDLADALALKSVPFRLAHQRVGAFVTQCEQQGKDVLSVGWNRVLSHFPELDDSFSLIFESSLERRSTLGGTARNSVERQLKDLVEFVNNA